MKFESKTRALNHHDILTPKHDLYLTADKIIKEKTNTKR